jgi:tetratricopeptide (TPR) repeat protein
VCAALVVAWLTAAATGHARGESPEAQVERLASEAVAAYRGADYNRAIELLQHAYEIRQVPALLYNMAKAYDKLGDVDHAWDAYRRYADSADADPKLKAKAEARLGPLEEARRKKAAASRALEPKPEPKPTPAEPPRPAVIEPPTPPPPTAEQIRDKLKRDRQRVRRRDRYVALGLGIGVVAFGGVAIGLSVSALQLQGDWSAQYGGVEQTRRDLQKEAQLRAAIADGFYALTAATAGVTAYFIYRGFRPEPAAPSLALVPVVSPSGGMLCAHGRF